MLLRLDRQRQQAAPPTIDRSMFIAPSSCTDQRSATGITPMIGLRLSNAQRPPASIDGPHRTASAAAPRRFAPDRARAQKIGGLRGSLSEILSAVTPGVTRGDFLGSENQPKCWWAHSITSSARISNVSGIVKPSAFAVFKLTSSLLLLL
jgi:hypothetical protein